MIFDADWRYRHLNWDCPNHPHWKAWDGYPESNWGPVLPGVCWLWDLITGGAAHD